MLSVSKLSLLATAAAFAAIPDTADAHGYLYQPTPSWESSPNPEWVTNVDYFWPEVGKGGDQVGIFKTMAEAKGLSVRDVVEQMAGDTCGHTLETGTKQAIPSDGLVIFEGNGGGGFTHVGPCEIWFDDTIALHGDNCQAAYPGGDVGSTDYSKMPVDYSLCVGDCVLRFYWLAFQNEQWQSYINCVPMTGGGSTATGEETITTVIPAAGSTTTSTTAPSTTTPATTTPATTTPATTAPATTASVTTTPATEAPETTAPVTTTPATTTPATTAPATTPPATTAPAADDDTGDDADTTEATPVPSCVARRRRIRH